MLDKKQHLNVIMGWRSFQWDATKHSKFVKSADRDGEKDIWLSGWKNVILINATKSRKAEA